MCNKEKETLVLRNEIIKPLRNDFACTGDRVEQRLCVQLGSDHICADSAFSAQRFLSCSYQLSRFSATNNREIWREIDPAHFQAKFAREVKILPRGNEEKYSRGEFAGGPREFRAYGMSQWI